MKAHVKVNIVIHLEGGNSPEEAAKLKHQLAAHHAGVVEVADAEEGARVTAALKNHVDSMFTNMGVKVLSPGHHVPSLSAAFGGEEQPKTDKNGETN